MSADRPFPDVVPVLVDPAAGVLLRAHDESDIPGIIEQCRDPETIRWTTVPTPEGGYGEREARAFLSTIPFGWEGGGPYVWAIELLAGAGREPVPFAGSIDLQPARARGLLGRLRAAPGRAGTPGDDVGAAARP